MDVHLSAGVLLFKMSHELLCLALALLLCMLSAVVQAQDGKLLTVQVDNGYVGAGDDTSLAHYKSQSSSPASDDSDTALQCEGSQGSLEMKATATLDRLGGWVLRLVGVFDADGIVCTTVRSLVRFIILESSFGGARGTLVLLVELGRACNWANGVYWLGEREGCDTRGGCGEELGGASDDARSKHCGGEWMTDAALSCAVGMFGAVELSNDEAVEVFCI